MRELVSPASPTARDATMVDWLTCWPISLAEAASSSTAAATVCTLVAASSAAAADGGRLGGRLLGGRRQALGGRLQLGRGRGDHLDDLADRRLELLGERQHVRLALRRRLDLETRPSPRAAGFASARPSRKTRSVRAMSPISFLRSPNGISVSSRSLEIACIAAVIRRSGEVTPATVKARRPKPTRSAMAEAPIMTPET